MIALADSSVLVASLVPDDPQHEACDAVLNTGDLRIYVHSIAEIFSTLTGGRQSIRTDPATATEVIAKSILPFAQTVTLSASDLLHAINAAQARGIRGGAIYDYLHLVAARKARAERFYTLNVSDFQAFHRSGDPEIAHP